MMRRKKYFMLSIFGAMLILTQSLPAQSLSSLMQGGNKAYSEKNYSSAENYYRRVTSGDQSQQYPQAVFNLGNTLFMQKKYDEAAVEFRQIALSKQKPALVSSAWFNLGNCLLEQKRFPESIAAYKQCLLLNSSDKDARYNLSLALAWMNRSSNTSSAQNNFNTPNMNLPKEQPLTDEEMKNLLNQLSQEESQTLDSVKRRTFSRKA